MGTCDCRYNVNARLMKIYMWIEDLIEIISNKNMYATITEIVKRVKKTYMEQTCDRVLTQNYAHIRLMKLDTSI
jgi:hypothetical protein